MQLTGVLSIGLLIAIVFLDLDFKGKVLNSRLIKKTRILIYSWLVVTFIYILIQIAYLLEQPLSASFDLTVIRSYLTQTSIGKSYLVQMILIVLVLLIPLKKVISDNTLMGQKWIHNQDISVEQAVNDFGKEIKQNLIIKSFIKYKVNVKWKRSINTRNIKYISFKHIHKSNNKSTSI